MHPLCRCSSSLRRLRRGQFHPGAALLFGLAGLILGRIDLATAAEKGLEVVADAPVVVFGGSENAVPVQFYNPTPQVLTRDLSWRLYQSTSGSSVPMTSDTRWKALSIGPAQRVGDVVRIPFPSVRGPALFHVVWLDEARRIGRTEVRVYPRSLLEPLRGLAGDKAIGVVDPAGRWTEALAGLACERLTSAESIRAFEGTMVLVLSALSDEPIAGLTGALKDRADRGAGIVWLHTPSPALPLPALRIFERASGRIVLADPGVGGDPAESPAAQLRLVALAELAAGRKTLALPGETETTQASVLP